MVVAQLALRTLPAAFNTWMVQGECFCAVYDAVREASARPGWQPHVPLRSPDMKHA